MYKDVHCSTALGIVGAHRRGVPERSGGMITLESPTAACGGNARMKKVTGVYMPNIGGIIKSLQNIMRKDPGVSGDAQRIEQLGWMVTLKILDDKEAELELLHDEYVSVVPEELKWRSWAADGEGITGDEMKDFVDTVLFPGLQNLDFSTGNKRAVLLRDIFAGIETLKANGYNLDIKNPYIKEEQVTHTTAELLELLHQSFIKSDTLLAELKEGLQ